MEAEKRSVAQSDGSEGSDGENKRMNEGPKGASINDVSWNDDNPLLAVFSNSLF